MFSNTPISYFSGTHRVISPSETIANNEKKLKIAGITRITEITHLDRVGIPVFSAIRPTAQEGGVSIYAGKGIKREQAKASAMMEAYERYSAEKQKIDNENMLVGTVEDIKEVCESNNLSPKNIIEPEEIILSKEVNKEELLNKNLEWVKSIDIITEEEFYIPSNAIYHPYVTEGKLVSNLKGKKVNLTPIFKGNTNGLASGNVLEEAVLHGIFEVIERDAWSIFELTKKNEKEININNIESKEINNVLRKFNDESINIKLMDITADINVTTIAASADDTILEDPALLTLGVGTHLNPEIAVLRALTEVAQSRATQIHGTREDTTRADFMRKAGYRRMKIINKQYFENEEDKINLKDIENKSTSSIKEDINRSVEEVQKQKLNKILFTNLTRPELNINVVRTIIPGTELYCLDPDRIGTRAIHYYNNY